MEKSLFSIITAIILSIFSIFFPEEAPQAPDIPAVSPAEGSLTVHYIDVGQADCILLESGGEFMLIDGGNVDDSQMVVSYLDQMGVETLRHVICTHAHEDHVGGLPAVLSKYKADAVYSPVTEYSSKVFGDFLKKTAAQGLELTVPSPGDDLSFGSVTATVLGPVQEYDDPNETSIILKVTCGGMDFLFTGDSETSSEADMLDYWGESFDWSIDVLKVGHHGSETSTGYRLLYETMPTYGVISVGTGNSYGHPHDAPMSRLKDAGVVTLRTDHLGHIIAQTDGTEVSFTWENQSAQPEAVEAGEPIVFYGNKKSKKLHAPICKNLPSGNNLVEFDHYDEAIGSGYTPCSSCLE